MSDEIQRRFAFAQQLADVAGEIVHPWFRTRITVSDKGSGGIYDPVTEADQRAEQAIRSRIASEFPQDGIVGEEFGDTAGTSGFTWVIDPIDGTRSFIAGHPLWGTLIGLEEQGRPVLGVLDQPFLRERFTGYRGKTELRDVHGATALATRACEHLSEAIVSTTHPITYFTEEERARFRQVEQVCRFSRYGGDCYAYALLAMGCIDLVIEAGLKHWDVAALIPIVEGAGGMFTDWNGGPALRGGRVVASGDAGLHARAVEILSDAAFSR